MTLEELRSELLRCESLSACDVFLQSRFHEIRPLFYGLTQHELQENHRYFDYEDVFVAFDHSNLGKAIRSEIYPPASVIALLVFFISLFERAGFYAAIRDVTNLMPAGSLRSRCEALFEFKNIRDTSSDYLARFNRILTLLQDAWNNSDEPARFQCENLLKEYALDAILESLDAGVDIRHKIAECFQSALAQKTYPIIDASSVQDIFHLWGNDLRHKRIALRSRIIESLHAEACSLAPDTLLAKSFSDDFAGKPISAPQKYIELPDFIDAQLEKMGAIYLKRRQDARFNFDSSSEDNRVYLGTYFPKTIIESWNIFTELFSIPILEAAFRQKDCLRILDIGSGTGAAVLGTLMALKSWGQCNLPIEITTIDTNEDALAKQSEIFNAVRSNFPFDLRISFRHQRLSFDLDGFICDLQDALGKENSQYDIITCWKCLSEFYNFNFSVAQGIIRNTLLVASRTLVPYGIFVVADVTTTDNGYEYFSMTLNRESRDYDNLPNARMHTILPLLCSNEPPCQANSCYTQRRFKVKHQLASHETKIAYRVFAPTVFAKSITTTFVSHDAYRVNAARPEKACVNGREGLFIGEPACGYTGFFTPRG